MARVISILIKAKGLSQAGLCCAPNINVRVVNNITHNNIL